jgi:hypothetical protein
MHSALKRFLRSPKIILGEIAGLALFGAAGAVWQEKHIFSSGWFVALTAVTTASLVIVVAEQFRRVRVGWTQRLTEAHFNSAPHRAEFERSATTALPERKIWSECRLGLAGSLVFHLGLLTLILAGLLRALFATNAVTDVLENETVAPQAAAWAGQFPGVLGKPFALDREITLREVKAARYADGDLQSLSLRLGVDGADQEIRVNQELRLGGNRIFSAREFGPAALVEWTQNGTTTRRAVLLSNTGTGNYEGELAMNGNLRAYFRSHIDRAGHHPDMAEIRVLNGSALLAAGILPAGTTLALPDGGQITLQGLPFWARLHGSRDAALWLAYAGMILTMTGAALMFALIKRDYCLVITPQGSREKVFIALRPQRFAPLFQERFDELVRAEFCRSRGDEAQTEIANRQSAIANQSEPPYIGAYDLGRAVSVVLLAACLCVTSGCDRVSPTDARQLVERYNQVVSEAYRRGDVRLIDPVVGPNEGKKLTGLIGVRLDMGITLDSKLDSLEILGVEQAKNELHVRTKEKWSYRDLKIGSGAQVGDASQDAYEMTYVFTNINQVWLVDEIKFAAPPQVGRTNTPWVADRATMHGMEKKEPKP